MHCADCEELLDELWRGELPARREAEVRSHLAGCQSCRGKHMRQLRAAELTAAAAPAPVHERRRRRRALWHWLRHGTAPASTQPGSSPRLGLLGRLPIVHQVATGTVMLLIVSVGLWSLPQLTRRPRFDAGAGHEPLRSAKHATEPAAATLEHSGETSTSPASQPPIAASSIHTEAARSSDLEAGLVHYHAREYAAATPLLSRALVSAGGADQAMTLLYLARAERALGHCDRAVNSYATLVRVHSKKVEAAAALREGVACYDDMAEPEHAQHLLEQAATTASLGGDARRLLAQRASNVKKPPSAPHGPTASSH